MIYHSNTSNGFKITLEVHLLSTNKATRKSVISFELFLHSDTHSVQNMVSYADVREGLQHLYGYNGLPTSVNKGDKISLVKSTKEFAHDSTGALKLEFSASFRTNTPADSKWPQTSLEIKNARWFAGSLYDTLVIEPIVIEHMNTDYAPANRVPIVVRNAEQFDGFKYYFQVHGPGGSVHTFHQSPDFHWGLPEYLIYGSLVDNEQIYRLTPNSLKASISVRVEAFVKGADGEYINTSRGATRYTTLPIPSVHTPRILEPTAMGGWGVYDVNPLSRALQSKLGSDSIQRVSRLRITEAEDNKAQAAYGATITKVEIDVEGAWRELPYTMETSVLETAPNNNGEQRTLAYTSRLRVTDSRGVSKTISIRLNSAYSYDFPEIKELQVQRSTADGFDDLIGENIKVKIKGFWHSLKSVMYDKEENFGEVRVYTKPKGSYGDYQLKATRRIESMVEESIVIPDHPIDTVYEVKVELSDLFGIAQATGEIKTGEAPFLIGPKGISVGKLPDPNYSIDTAGPINTDTDFLFQGESVLGRIGALEDSRNTLRDMAVGSDVYAMAEEVPQNAVRAYMAPDNFSYGGTTTTSWGFMANRAGQRHILAICGDGKMRLCTKETYADTRGAWVEL